MLRVVAKNRNNLEVSLRTTVFSMLKFKANTSEKIAHVVVFDCKTDIRLMLVSHKKYFKTKINY